MKYRDNMTPEELQAFMSEIELQDAAYCSHPADTGEVDEEAAHMEELERGYAQDRI